MKLEDALYHAVHDYGVAKLAGQMGIAESTLQNLANPRITTHEWSLKKIRQVIDFTGDLRVAHAFAGECGGMFLPLVRELDGVTDIYRHITNLAKEFGDIPAEVQDSLKDGNISQADRERIHQQIYEMVRAAHNLGLYVDSLANGPTPTLSVVKK